MSFQLRPQLLGQTNMFCRTTCHICLSTHYAVHIAIIISICQWIQCPGIAEVTASSSSWSCRMRSHWISCRDKASSSFLLWTSVVSSRSNISASSISCFQSSICSIHVVIWISLVRVLYLERIFPKTSSGFAWKLIAPDPLFRAEEPSFRRDPKKRLPVNFCPKPWVKLKHRGRIIRWEEGLERTS